MPGCCGCRGAGCCGCRGAGVLRVLVLFMLRCDPPLCATWPWGCWPQGWLPSRGRRCAATTLETTPLQPSLPAARVPPIRATLHWAATPIRVTLLRAATPLRTPVMQAAPTARWPLRPCPRLAPGPARVPPTIQHGPRPPRSLLPPCLLSPSSAGRGRHPHRTRRLAQHRRHVAGGDPGGQQAHGGAVWSFGCRNCKNTLEALGQLYADFRHEGVEIVGVALAGVLLRGRRGQHHRRRGRPRRRLAHRPRHQQAQLPPLAGGQHRRTGPASM